MKPKCQDCETTLIAFRNISKKLMDVDKLAKRNYHPGCTDGASRLAHKIVKIIEEKS